MFINECAMYIATILNRDIYIKVFIGHGKINCI